MNPEITPVMAEKMLKHCAIDIQFLEKADTGLILHGELCLSNGYVVCSHQKETHENITLDVLYSKEQSVFFEKEKAQIKILLLDKAKEILMGYRGFQF